MIAIGFTGLSGCGKDIAASFLSDICSSSGYSVVLYEFADVIREELKKREIDNGKESRKLLLDLGNELRETYGFGVLAQRIISNYRQLKKETNLDPDILIATGIRNKGEVDAFRDEWGSNFILISVLASDNIRSERKISRSQYKEDKHSLANIEKADQDIGILECMEISDIQIPNNGTIHELKDTMAQFFKDRLLPILSSQPR